MPDQDGMAVVENFNREKLTIGVDYREGGSKEEEDEKLAKIVEVLEAGGGSCERVESIQSERWIKVIWYVYYHPAPIVPLPLPQSRHLKPERQR